MTERWVVLVAGCVLALTACGDDASGSGGSADDAADGLEADAEALVECLDEAGVDATVKDSKAFGVEVDHVGVEADDLPTELLKYNSGSGTLSGVSIWLFEDAAAAEESRAVVTLKKEDDESGWADGRALVSWYYPVDRTQPQAVAVDECVAELNG